LSFASPQSEDTATTFIGRYAGLNVYEYDGIYVESELGSEGKYADTVKDMIGQSTAILASTAMAGTFLCRQAMWASTHFSRFVRRYRELFRLVGNAS
jgi:hypothetical protein